MMKSQKDPETEKGNNNGNKDTVISIIAIVISIVALAIELATSIFRGDFNSSDVNIRIGETQIKDNFTIVCGAESSDSLQDYVQLPFNLINGGSKVGEQIQLFLHSSIPYPFLRDGSNIKKVVSFPSDVVERRRYSRDYVCYNIAAIFDSEHVYIEEPIGLFDSIIKDSSMLNIFDASDSIFVASPFSISIQSREEKTKHIQGNIVYVNAKTPDAVYGILPKSFIEKNNGQLFMVFPDQFEMVNEKDRTVRVWHCPPSIYTFDSTMTKRGKQDLSYIPFNSFEPYQW